MRVYSLEVDRSRPKDYVFSSVLSAETLLYPVVASNNFEAMYYPPTPAIDANIPMIIIPLGRL